MDKDAEEIMSEDQDAETPMIMVDTVPGPDPEDEDDTNGGC